MGRTVPVENFARPIIEHRLHALDLAPRMYFDLRVTSRRPSLLSFMVNFTSSTGVDGCTIKTFGSGQKSPLRPTVPGNWYTGPIHLTPILAFSASLMRSRTVFWSTGDSDRTQNRDAV